jgi:hypothetical protein
MSGGDQNRQVELHLGDSLVQRGASLGFTAPAAIGAAGTGLQFGERSHAVGGSATDIVVGDGVTQTDVHGTHFNANANDCQQVFA